MHHLHISTPALFVIALFVFGIVTVIFAMLRSMKQDRLDAQRALSIGSQSPNYPQYSALHRDGSQPAPVVRSYGSAAPSAPVYVAPAYTPYYGVDPGLAMVEGMLIGEALSHHDHTTIINEGTTYVDTPSYDSGISYDSSPSFDTDTSGGVSFDW